MKIFISYSWKSPDNIAWVEKLINKLRRDKLEVLVDREELQPGDDINQFMEQILNPEIQKVFIICDKYYKSDADARTGGVGKEFGMIADDINKNPRKYVPVVKEIDEKGQPYIPASLRGRFYIDFTKDSNAAYRQLLSVLLVEKEEESEQPSNATDNAISDSAITNILDSNLHSSKSSDSNICTNLSLDVIKAKGYFDIDIDKSSIIFGEKGKSRLESVVIKY